MPKPTVRELKETLKARGVDVSKIQRQIEADVDELLNSASLKLFRYESRNHKSIHLYAEVSSGRKMALCGIEITEDVPAGQIDRLRGDECLKCRTKAKEILGRKR